MTSSIIQRRKLPAAIPAYGELHPILARLYATRNVRHKNELEYGLKHLLPYKSLRGIETAVALLITAIETQQKVIVVGDFDADGATSTALAVKALKMLGLQNIDYLVPNRFKYGYGLTPGIVEQASLTKPDLIITVDNGISSLQGVARAKELGIHVLITDHHLAAEQLPDAEAIVNPNQPGCEFKSKALPGVGVIFYVMLALRAALREANWFAANNIAEPNLAVLLDLVALGIVADVVPLDYNNRILVSQGIARVRAGQCRAGILALLEVAGRDHSRLVSSDFGFCVAPRINAAGRLDDMSLGIECLLTDDPQRAGELASQLEKLNRERRNIEDEMKQQALTLLDNMQLDDDLPVGVCLFEEDWHEGVVGIVASRLKDRLHRPVIAFARAANGEIKGSARSVKGVHIRDMLDAIAARYPDLISRFGGHAMAAGLSLAGEHFTAFSRAFNEEVAKHLSEDDLHGVLVSDGALEDSDIDLSLAETLRSAGPWGQAFEEPLFDGQFEVVEKRIVGEKHLKMLLKSPHGEQLYDAIAFFMTDESWPQNVTRVETAYRLDVNDFRGVRNVQLMIQHLQPL